MKLETDTQWKDAENKVFCRICKFGGHYLWATDKAQGVCDTWDAACGELEDSLFEEEEVQK
jgi:hypothetical protein